MFNVVIGIIVGSIPRATVIVVAVLTLVTNFAYNMWLLSKAEVPLSALTVSLRDWANIGLNFAINLLLALISAAVTFGFRRRLPTT